MFHSSVCNFVWLWSKVLTFKVWRIVNWISIFRQERFSTKKDTISLKLEENVYEDSSFGRGGIFVCGVWPPFWYSLNRADTTRQWSLLQEDVYKWSPKLPPIIWMLASIISNDVLKKSKHLFEEKMEVACCWSYSAASGFGPHLSWKDISLMLVWHNPSIKYLAGVPFKMHFSGWTTFIITARQTLASARKSFWQSFCQSFHSVLDF